MTEGQELSLLPSSHINLAWSWMASSIRCGSMPMQHPFDNGKNPYFGGVFMLMTFGYRIGEYMMFYPIILR